MERRTLIPDSLRLARDTSIATYLGLVGPVEGATVTKPLGMTLVRGPGPFSFCNFASAFQVREDDVEEAIALLEEQAVECPGFYVFAMTGDTPADLTERLIKRGFVDRLELVCMVGAKEAQADHSDIALAASPQERMTAAGFMARQFFWRMPRQGREAIAAATAASSHTIWLVGPQKSPIGAVMLVETPESVGLYNLCVRPDSRGSGIGANLVNAVLQAAHKSGRPVVLQCEPELAAWYERLGFVEVGRLNALSFQNGETSDILSI